MSKTRVRNAVVALPVDADLGLADAVWEAMAGGEPDKSAAEPLRWTGSTLVALAGEGRGLVN